MKLTCDGIVDTTKTAAIFTIPKTNHHREILCGPDPKGGSEIPSIYRDQPLSALDLPLSTFPGLSPFLILLRAGLWMHEYTGIDLIID